MSVQSITSAVQNADLKVEKLKNIKESEELLFNNEVEENEGSQENSIEFLEDETQTGKVSFKEGLSLVGKGFVNKLKSIGTAIVEHPLRTAATLAGTSALLMAAPIVGISTATAGAFLAIGFGAFAIGKTTKDVVETVKDDKEGRYDEVRQDLEELGGDGVDLALTLPFMPKAIKQVSRFAKYGTSTVGINTELLSNLKNSKSLSEVSLNLAKANTKINYEMIANEMGLANKPELLFKTIAPKDGVACGGFYEPAEGKMYFNEDVLKFSFKKVPMSPDEILRHELQHYQQFVDIGSVYGEDALKSAIADYYAEGVKEFGAKTTTPDADITAIEKPIKTEADIVKPNYETNLAENAPEGCENTYKMLDEFYGKLNEFYEKYKPTTDEYNLELDNYYTSMEEAIKNKTGYNKAVTKLANETAIPKETIENMTNGDMSVYNSQLYKEAVNSNSATYTASDIERVDSYLKGLEQKVHPDEEAIEAIFEKYGVTLTDKLLKTQKFLKAQMEAYRLNPLEDEAFTVQEAFKAEGLVTNTNIANDLASQLTLTEDKINSYTDDNTIMDNLNSTLDSGKCIMVKTGSVGGILNYFKNLIEE